MFRRNSKWPDPSLRRSVKPRETASSVWLSGIQPEPLSRLGLPRERIQFRADGRLLIGNSLPFFLTDLRGTTSPPLHRPDCGKTTFPHRLPISLLAKLWEGSGCAAILAWQKRFSHRVGPQVFRRMPAVTAWNRRFPQLRVQRKPSRRRTWFPGAGSELVFSSPETGSSEMLFWGVGWRQIGERDRSGERVLVRRSSPGW